MSARWSLGAEDMKSVLRHTVIPFVAAVGVAALQAVQAGAVTPKAVVSAAITAAVAGAIRLLGRWSAENP